MKYGIIGESLIHSFSKEIHEQFAPYKYEICEIKKENLKEFFIKKDFLGINVTIPYKQLVIPYLNYIDDNAKEIGAINTIVNKNGTLYGYNTDFDGMIDLINKNNIIIKNKTVLICGSGGTSSTAKCVSKKLGAKEIIIVGRNKKENVINYEEAYKQFNKFDIIINTTPIGMFPKTDSSPIDINIFSNAQVIIDCIYNPLRSELVYNSIINGKKATGGLYMLVSQAIRASEKFLNIKYEKNIYDEVYNKILNNKENIVLIGMPGSGKSTIGEVLSSITKRKIYDTDTMIIQKCNMQIKEIFDKFGEEYFRNIEEEVIKEVSKFNNIIISTGGGSILRNNNIMRLKQNGKIFFIDRKVENIIPTKSRPLSNNIESLKKLYNERINYYLKASDIIIKNDKEIEDVVKEIINIKEEI
ncbi:MAG: shikimate kinase [Eubacteriales bacterium]|nr:shikimate kinase [Eubacteriales bacterium]